MKVCHIVNWYPNKENSKEAIWTKNHIQSLNKFCDNSVFHVQVREGKFKYESRVISEYEKSFILYINIRLWFIKELLTTALLLYVILFKMKRSKYDIFNFQITYPLLTYSKLICRIVKKPIVVTEHWSAYHLNFGVTKELKRIKRIFKNKKLSFICVSRALVSDIEEFSEQNITSFLVPNAISEDFRFLGKEKQTNSFFMLSFWKKPKNPLVILKVFKKLKSENFKFKLIIGGYGPMVDEMTNAINDYGLMDDVFILGKLDQSEIISQLNLNSYFIHNSNYEVASVVCGEALCCGTPVIASAVGGIVEYINQENGILVKENDMNTWYNAIKKALLNDFDYDNSGIATKAGSRFHTTNVGALYFEVLLKIKNNN